MERPNVTSRVTKQWFVAPCDNKEVDACNDHEFVAPCDNFVASHDNTGTVILMLLSLSLRETTSVRPTYSGRVLFLPFLPMGVVALCNNLVTPCDNEVEHGRGLIPMAGRGQRARTARALGVYLRVRCRGEHLSPPVTSSSSSSAEDVPTKGPALLAEERSHQAPRYSSG